MIVNDKELYKVDFQNDQVPPAKLTLEEKVINMIFLHFYVHIYQYIVINKCIIQIFYYIF